MQIFFSYLVTVLLLFQNTKDATPSPCPNETKVHSEECAEPNLREMLFAKYPAKKLAQQRLDRMAAMHVSKQKKQGASNKMADYTLPVVFHIIHQNGPENITDAQVLQALGDLNNAYANSNFYGGNDGVDTKIQFCLARRDPNGNATTGINRVVSPLTDLTFATDIAMKDLIRWNPLEYINIWLVRNIEGGSIAGYAYLPASHGGPEDGIVMLGSIMPNLGGGHSTLVHEMGHYLGLYHTFEGNCTNADCSLDGDLVCDTPPDGTTAPPGDCNAIINSCSTDAQSGFPTDQNDINWNYVDYGNQPCRNGYTQGQADRMAFFIENARQSLLNSQACQDPCLNPIAASFTPSSTTVNIGGSVNFTNTTSGGTTYEWSVNGSPFSTSANAVYTFNTLGTFEVSLNAANADPNCEGSASATIEVVCPINAVFSTSNLYPSTGETVVFTNASTGATNYSWTINGNNVSTAANFSNTFSSPGQNNICLQVSSGLCSEQFCQLVFVTEDQTSGECSGTFVQIFGSPGLQEFAHAFLLLPDGNLLIGGNRGNASLLLCATPGGDILWAKTFDFTAGNDFIFEMMLDSDGMLVATGRDQLNAPTTTYFFKFNLQNQSIVWQKLFPPSFSRLETLLEKSPGGNYYLFGMVDDNNMFMEVNRNTGNVVLMEQYDYGQTDFFLNAKVYNGSIYTAGLQRNGGLGEIRASMTKLSLTGTENWTRFYFNSLNETARTYFYENIVENDTIVAYGRGDLDGDSFTDGEILLMKANLNGDFLWAKRYNLPNSNTEFSGSFIPLPDGYILQGNHLLNANGQSEYFIMRVNKQGNIIWAKSIKNIAGDWGKYALYDDGFIYFTGRTNQLDAAGDVMLGKMSLDGEVVGPSCSLVSDLEVIENDVANDYDGSHPLSDISTSYNLTNANEQPVDAQPTKFDVVGCECNEFTPDCNQTFVTAYGSPTAEEGRRILAVPEGWVFTAAKTDSLIIGLLDESGHLLWQRSMSFSANLTERARDLILTSDGHIIGCGSTAEGSLSTWNNFVFKYDYQNKALLWQKVFNYGSGDRSSLVNLLELPNGNILATGDDAPNNGPGLGCDAIWLELNPSNGNTVFLRNYNLGSCETFFSPIFSNDGTAIYATGRYNTAGGGTDKFRAPITKLDLDGNELWTRLYLRSSSQTARLYGVSVLEENAGLFVFGQGDLSGTSTTAVTLQILKTDAQGDILWAKNYDLPGANTESVIEAISVPDGFLVLGNYTQGDQDIFLIKTDKNGTVQWAKSYGGTSTEVANDMAYQNGQIFILGKTSSFGNGNDDMLLIKLGLDGEILDNSCSFSANLSPTEAPIQNPYDGSHPLTAYTPTYPSTSPAITQQIATLAEAQLCFTPCADTCANGLPIHTMPDAVLQSISAQCNGDSMLVAIEICNADSVALPAGTPLSFYQNNPTTAAASLLGTGFLPNEVQPGECLSFNLALPLPANQQIFAIVNDNGTTPSPFNLEDDFPNTATQECDFTNNIGSFTVNYTPPVLDLGPDQARCDFQVTELDAGAGFASYQWSVPGNTGQVFTAWQPGTYSVTATDQCGATQTDEITLSVLAATVLEIGVDTATVCEGDSASFSVGGFVDYQWFPPDLVDCATCPNVTVAQPVDTCLILVATDGNGCYSADTVCLKVIQGTTASDTMTFCQGDTVLVFGNPVTVAGTYTMTFMAENGCDSVHTIHLVSAADTIELITNAFICTGDVYDFHGTPLTMPGAYHYYDNSGACVVHETLFLTVDTLQIMTFAVICQGDFYDFNGTQITVSGTYEYFDTTGVCDALEILEIIVGDTFSIYENLTICEGDTALIFGTPTTAPGTYTMSYAAQYGCDSTHTITLTVLPAIETTETITICENEVANIFGNDTNVPGIYQQSYSLPNGCDSTHTINLVVNDTFVLQQNISICQGDSVLIFGNWETQAGIYTQVLTTPLGCDSTIAVTLTVGQSFQVNFETEIACPFAFDGVVTALPTGGTPPFSYDWLGFDTVLVNQLTGLDVGTYYVAVTDATGCAVLDSVELGAAVRPDVSTETVGVSCFGVNDGSLTILANDPSLQYLFLNSTPTTQTNFDSLWAGGYQYSILDTVGCQWLGFFTIESPDAIQLELPGVVQAPHCDSVQIEATSPVSPLEWSWSPSEFLSCSDCPNPIAYPLTTTTYYLTAVDSNDCSTTDSVVVVVEFDGKAYIPNVFSPNDDGINDVFMVLTGCVREVKKMLIFDRWGEKVFEESNTPPNDPLYGWDGNFRGKPMNPDVFVYYIIVELYDGTEKTYKGDLTLLR